MFREKRKREKRLKSLVFDSVYGWLRTKGPWKLNNENSKWEPVITLSEELNNYKWDNTKKYHSKQSRDCGQHASV